MRAFAVLASMALMLPSLSVLAAVPAPELIPSDPKAYTQAKFDEAQLAFLHRTTTEVYRKSGVRSDKWDAEAIRFLEGYVEQLAGKMGAPSQREFAQQAKVLVDAGCDDPLVLAVCGRSLCLDLKHAEAEPVLRRAVDALAKSAYPKCRTVVAPMFLAIALRAQGKLTPEEQSRLEDLAVKWTVESFQDGSFRKGEDRLIADTIQRIAVTFQSFGKVAKLYDAIQSAPAASPWVEKYLAGAREYGLAWAARGDGWGYKVTDEGWKGFGQHLDAAGKLLTDAWKLHPEYPEAPTRMIGVAMGGHAGEGETPRLWFKRAVSAQVDYIPAYTAYRWASRPRWGGSVEEIHEFGVDCLRTRRFDTAIPWQYVCALQDVAEELSGDAKYWTVPETWKRLQMLFDGYAKAGNVLLGTADQRESLRAAAAARCERYAEAKRIVDQLGDRMDRTSFAKIYRSGCTDGIERIRVFGGPHGQDLLKAERLRKKGDYGQALAAYKQLGERLKGDEQAATFARNRIEVIGIEKDFEQGGWVDLKPGPDFANWIVGPGTWSIEDGAIVGTGDSCDARLLCNAGFGDRYEIRGEAEMLSRQNGYAMAGVLLNSGPCQRFAWFSNGIDTVSIGSGDLTSGIQKQHAGVKDKNTFLVQQWDDDITLWLNGKLVQGPLTVERQVYTDIPSMFGLSASVFGEGSAVRFRNLQVRRMEKMPQASQGNGASGN